MNTEKLIECLHDLYAEQIPDFGYDDDGKMTLDQAATKKHMESELKRPLTDLEETVLSFGRRELGPTPALPRSEAKRLHKAIWKGSSQNHYDWLYLAHALFVINETGEYFRAPLRIQRRMYKRAVASEKYDDQFAFLRYLERPVEDDPKLALRYKVGQWMRFTQDYAIGKNEFIVSGMLGVVEPDPYSLCPPGEGAMVCVLGTKITYGFPIEFLDPIPEPDPDQKAQAIKDASRAWEIIKEKGSWLGYPFRNLDSDTVLKELQVHLRKLPDANDPEYLLGTMKRIRKVLCAFSPSPWGKEALELSKRCEQHIKPEPPPKELLEDIRMWISTVYSGLPPKQVIEKIIHLMPNEPEF